MGVVVAGFWMLFREMTNEVPPFTTTELMFIKKEVEFKRTQVEEIEQRHELDPVDKICDGSTRIILELAMSELMEVNVKVRLVTTPIE